MYLIVVGAGDIGSRVVEVATRADHEVVVIEQNQQRAQRIKEEYDCLMINADATSHEIMLEAGPDAADALISTTENDATNLMVMMLGGEFDIPTLVSVVHNPRHMPFFEKISATGMANPQEVIADRLLSAVERPSIVDFLEIGDDAEVFEVLVDEGSPIAGMSLEEADSGLIPPDSLVVAIKRGDRVLVPRRDIILEVDDLVTVFSKSGVTPDVVKAFHV